MELGRLQFWQNANALVELAFRSGTGAGLCGWNCRHSFSPYWPEFSERTWSDEALAQLDAKTIEYNGKQYSEYEISQMQRALERKVRYAKRQYLAQTAAGQDAAAEAVQLRQARQNLKAFANATQQSTADSVRTYVHGFGRSEASKATAAAKKQERYDAANEELQQLRKSGTIKATGKLVDPPAAPAKLEFGDHAKQRLAERNMTEQDAWNIINNATFAIEQRNGIQHVYYHSNGFICVANDGAVGTLGELDDGGKKIMEVAEKHGFKAK